MPVEKTKATRQPNISGKTICLSDAQSWFLWSTHVIELNLTGKTPPCHNSGPCFFGNIYIYIYSKGTNKNAITCTCIFSIQLWNDILSLRLQVHLPFQPQFWFLEAKTTKSAGWKCVFLENRDEETLSQTLTLCQMILHWMFKYALWFFVLCTNKLCFPNKNALLQFSHLFPLRVCFAIATVFRNCGTKWLFWLHIISMLSKSQTGLTTWQIKTWTMQYLLCPPLLKSTSLLSFCMEDGTYGTSISWCTPVCMVDGLRDFEVATLS